MQAQAEIVKTESLIAEFRPTEAALAKLQEMYGATVWDVSTKERMEAAKKARAEIRRWRTDLEDARKEKKKKILEDGRLLDSEANRIKAQLEELEQPVAEAIKEVEDKAKREKQRLEREEEERVDAARAEIDRLKGIPAELIGASIEKLATTINELNALDLTGLAEFEGHGTMARDGALSKLTEMHSREVAHEEQQAQIANERAELERLQAEQAERDRIANEDREAEDKERRAKLEADEKAAKELFAEETRRLEERRTAEEKELAEERRRADEAREKADAEARKEREEARKKQEAEDKRLREQREKLEAEQRAEAKRQQEREEAEKAQERERQRKRDDAAREEQNKKEAAEREEQRKLDVKLNARAMLNAFCERYGELEEFAGIVKVIAEYFTNIDRN